MANYAQPNKILSNSILINRPFFLLWDGFLSLCTNNSSMSEYYTFLHLTQHSKPEILATSEDCILSKIPLTVLIPLLAKECLAVMAINLNLTCINSQDRRDEYVKYLLNNLPDNSSDILSVFKLYTYPSKRKASDNENDNLNGHRAKVRRVELTQASTSSDSSTAVPFPPSICSQAHRDRIITAFINDSNPNCFEETGCAVCAELVPKKDTYPLAEVMPSLRYLKKYAFVTRKEQKAGK